MSNNERIPMLNEWLKRIEGKVDALLKENAAVCATVRTHGAALRILYGIVAGIVVAIVGFVIRG